jgi:preprotein translocase subunit YajC
MIAIFYFMIIRPQNRREKERKALINSVKSGQRILFAGGLLGTVATVKDKTLMVKISDNVKIEVSKGAVTTVIPEGESIDDSAV